MGRAIIIFYKFTGGFIEVLKETYNIFFKKNLNYFFDDYFNFV